MNNTRSEIINTITKLKKANVSQIIKNLPTKKSRTWISTTLNQLTKDKILARSQKGVHVYYTLFKNIDLLNSVTKKKYQNINLNEDMIYQELKQNSIALQELNENIDSIINYAFTEMVNNAIEHSQSKYITITTKKTANNIIFEVVDEGIGVYRNIKERKNLKTELESIQELLKGKTTTLPHSHSGEGIFFTSKIADIFVLDSFDYRLRIDNTVPDVFVEKIHSTKGTHVRFEINHNSKKRLSDMFHEYESEPGSHSFDKTRVHVKLFKAGTVYISRSQARRLMHNLEKFRLIILDFKDIKTVGQAFADEVFRVFASKHPKIIINPINMENTVEFMINRVDKPTQS
jgi:anti-sigma regulatory factor (Ser/Thr protein kinase)/uncharacterized protein (DUF1330 family)